jgi:hypothetical protein
MIINNAKIIMNEVFNMDINKIRRVGSAVALVFVLVTSGCRGVNASENQYNNQKD